MKTSRRPGRPVGDIIITVAEREALERYARGRTVSSALALCARLVLRCADGAMLKDVARELDVTPQTVGKWRRRFIEFRIEGLADAPKPNIDRKLADERVEEVVRLTLEAKPAGSTHWSTRKLAKQAGVSQSSVSRIWRAFHLKPHRRKTFTLSTDDFFVEKVRDIVGLYLNPPDHAVVLCLDEKSQIQALERTQLVLPVVFGYPERVTATYMRHGTTNLFAALDIATGKVIGECYPLKRAAEFRRFLARVDRAVPAGLDLHVVVDNSSIHNAPTVHRWLTATPPRRLTTGVDDADPVFSRDGKTIFFQRSAPDGTHEVASVAVDATTPPAGALVHAAARRPALGAAPTELVYVAVEGKDLYGVPTVLDLHTGGTRLLVPTHGGLVSRARVSLDGKRAALLAPSLSEVLEIELSTGAVTMRYESGADDVRDLAYGDWGLYATRLLWSGGVWIGNDPLR